MPPDRNEDLRKAYRITAFIGLAMFASLVIYAVVVEIIRKQNAPFHGFSPLPPEMFLVLRSALLGVAAVEFFVINILNKVMLSGKVAVRGSQAAGLQSLRAQQLMTASVVSYALCESVAVYGLVLFMVQGSADDFYLFLLLSLGYYAVYFPRYERWGEWAEKQARGGE